MHDIRVFYTHIEVSNYTKGDDEDLERYLSKYDRVRHKDIPVCYYIENNTLYLPRGMSIPSLERKFKTRATIMPKCDEYDKFMTAKILYEPRDRIQEEAVRFLRSEGEFQKGRVFTQLGLNLDTGDGKTYCMINAIVHQKMKAIIITHKSSLKEQWYDEILDKSTLTKYDVMDLDGSDKMLAVLKGKKSANIYLVNHQTIREFAKREGWESVREFFKVACIGIKVYDECHKYFNSTFMIDCFSNTSRSYYLTATFLRGDPKEEELFSMAFSNMYRFGEETLDYEEKRKHIVLIVIYYDSKPPLGTSVNNICGFSDYLFIDYAFKLDENHTLEKVLRRILRQSAKTPGRTLITSPKIESVEKVKEILEDEVEGTIGTIHSKNTDEDNEFGFKQADYISSTIQSLGEGNDIKKLRKLINLDPVGSKVLADQLRGRLRMYSEEDDTFMFYPVDVGFKETVEMFNRIYPVMKRKCKEIIKMNWFDL